MAGDEQVVTEQIEPPTLDISTRINKTLVIAEAVSGLWGGAYPVVDAHGVDHSLIHAAVAHLGSSEWSLGGPSHVGSWPSPTITAYLKERLPSPVLFGRGDPTCPSCIAIVGEPAPAEAAGGAS